MWYRITYAPEPRLMGVDTQVTALHADALRFKQELEPLFYDQELNSSTVIDYVELKNKAKWTDVLWDYTLTGGLLISEKTKAILDQHRLWRARFYPAVVKKGDETRKYFYIRLAYEINDEIDYGRSVFSWEHGRTFSEELVAFRNFKELRAKVKEAAQAIVDTISPEKLYFTRTFLDQQYDMIFLGCLSPTSFWVSERLKNALEAEGCRGFEFPVAEFMMSE